MEHIPSSTSPVLQRTLNQLKFAAKAWREWNRERALPGDRVLANVFQENRKVLGSRDRKFISGAVHAVFRNQTFYEYWLQKFAQSDLRDPVKQAKFLCLMGAATDGTIDAEIFAGAWGLIKDRAELEQPAKLFEAVKNFTISEKRENVSPEGWLALRYSFPIWLVERWARAFGAEESGKIIEASHSRPPLVIRVNTLKISRDELIKKMPPEINAAPVPDASAAVLFGEHAALKNLPEFNDGYFEIQALASQRAAEFAAPKPGEKIWDVCAGGGGKTLYFAALMKNEGQVIATDLRSLALKELKARADRAGAKIIKVADIQRFYKGEANDRFDKIVVDAPCSGSGTFARAPDLKWRLTENSFGEYAAKQLEILEAVLPFLKPEGSLAYMTCSVDPEENEGVTEKFLARHSELQLEGEPLRIWPQQENTDGFFMVKFCFKQKGNL